MSTLDFVRRGVRVGVKCVLAGVFVGLALSASVTSAAAEVVPGTEDGWGRPPGGVTLSVVGDDGSGNHSLTVTWGAVDPVPADGGYWQCEVDERTLSNGSSTLNAYFDVKLDPASGGSFQRQVSEVPGARIKMSLQCSTLYPGSGAATPPSAPFGWHFDYQLS